MWRYSTLLYSFDTLPRKEHWLNGLNYDYLKLRKEEVIYKGLVYTNTWVLQLYTAYASLR
jgi:hypothetical protein